MFLFGKKKHKKNAQSARKQGFSHGFAAGSRQTRRFNAAKVTDLTADWGAGLSSINRDLQSDLRNLRARSRILSKNDPYFARFLHMCGENVVGSQGITCRMHVTRDVLGGGEPVPDEQANRIIEDAWKRWCKQKNCTVSGGMSWIDVQQLAIRNMVRDGEILIRIVRNYANAFKFALQLIPADHLDEEYTEDLRNGHTIRMGIEFNAWKKPVAYHIFADHPYDDGFGGFSKRGRERMRIPAEDMIHAFLPSDMCQIRGFPAAAPAMTRSNMLAGYEESELVASRIASSKMGFFKSKTGDAYTGDDLDEGEDGQGARVAINEASPGHFEQLPEGFDFEAFDPQHPASAYQHFIKGILRGIASGMNVSYNTLANDYEKVNYSSLRQANLSERETWKCYQRYMIEHVCEPIFTEFLMFGLTTGTIALSIREFDRLNRPVFRARGWQWVDPLKEVKAHETSVRLKLKSRTQIANDQGDDIEEIAADIERETALLGELPAESNNIPEEEEETDKEEDEDDAEEDKDTDEDA